MDFIIAIINLIINPSILNKIFVKQINQSACEHYYLKLTMYDIDHLEI